MTLEMQYLVAANVRATAAYRGFSAAAVARSLAVTDATVSRKWRGIRAWSFGELDSLGTILGVEPWTFCQPNVNLTAAPVGACNHCGVAGQVVPRAGLEPATKSYVVSHLFELAA